MESIKISALIIDDDSDAINLLEMFLRQFSYIQIIGKSTNAIEGLDLINHKTPDMIFLDIDMPDMNGLQVAESVKINKLQTEIVFTTAYQHYAYKALSVEPLDFLTKPFYPDDLEKVIKKYMVRKDKKKHEQKLEEFILSKSNPPKITLLTAQSLLIIDVNDIVFIKANLYGSIVYFKDGTFESVSKTLYNIIDLINSTLIFQIQRGTYVNLNYVHRIDRKKRKCFIRFNNSIHEEPITKSSIINFEKLNIFPLV